ncbi:MAG: peptidylprolyl isomerase [Bacteroidales bacterium]|nr:peptidylprolyl isomerase [Bacteroidales bacterium]
MEKAAADSIAKATEEANKKAEAKLGELSETPVFDVITSEGTIRIRLYAETPKHRDNFCKLALSGFYNGTQFHRIIRGFMIQGGDPYSKIDTLRDKWGQGGPGYEIPAEFVPQLTHKKGALAAARRGDTANPLRESSGSQFYIVQDPVACSHLDGAYTVFGETLEGLNIIDKIASVSVDERDRPLKPVRIVSIKYVPTEP